jgi:hypothetical protein
MNENIKVTGHIDLVLKDESGSIKDTREIKNLVVTAGKNYLAAWLAAASQAGYFMQYIGLGTGTTPAAAGDTALETPLATRVAGTVTSSTNVWQNVATFGPGVDTGAVTEAGLFTASSSGTMFARQVFSVINKGAADSLEITWTVTLS